MEEQLNSFFLCVRKWGKPSVDVHKNRQNHRIKFGITWRWTCPQCKWKENTVVTSILETTWRRPWSKMVKLLNSFKTSTHKPMGDFTMTTSTFYMQSMVPICLSWDWGSPRFLPLDTETWFRTRVRSGHIDPDVNRSETWGDSIASDHVVYHKYPWFPAADHHYCL